MPEQTVKRRLQDCDAALVAVTVYRDNNIR